MMRSLLRTYFLPVVASVVFFLILAPVLVGKWMFAGGDLTNIAYPHLVFYQDALRAGDGFLWNPQHLAGFPSFASLADAFLSPVNYVVYSLFPAAARQWLIFLYAVLGAYFTGLLLRAFGLSRLAQALGGVVYVASQWSRIPDTGIANGVPLLPLLLLIVWYGRKGRWWIWIPAGGAVIGYLFLSTHYNWIPIILAGAGFFALFLGYYDAQREGRRYTAHPPVRFAAMAAIGILIGLVQMIPALILVAFSSRSGGLNFREAAVHGIGLFDLVRVYLPYFYPPFIATASAQLHVGIIPLFLALSTFALREPIARFFVGLFALSLAISIKFSPLFWVLLHVPGLSFLRVQDRWMFIGMFAFAVLSAYGFERILKERSRWELSFARLFAYSSMLVATGSLLVAGVLFFFRSQILTRLEAYFISHIYPQTSGLPLTHYQRVIEQTLERAYAVVDPTRPEILLSLLFLVVSACWCFWYRRENAPREIVRRVGFSLAMANIIAIFFFYLPLIPKDTFFAKPDTAAFLEARPGRYFTFAPGLSEWTTLTVPHGPNLEDAYRFQSWLLAPNMNLAHRVEGIDAYDPLMSRSIARFLALIGSDRATTGEKLVDEAIPPQEKIEKFKSRKHLLDLLGVRYVVSVFPLGGAPFREISTLYIPPHRIALHVYENSSSRPLLYGAERTVAITPNEEDAFRMIAQGVTRDGAVLLECNRCPAPRHQSSATVEMRERHNVSLRAVTRSAGGFILVFNEQYLPGWRATIDGKETHIVRANSLFQAIEVPAGEHEVRFSYGWPRLREILAVVRGDFEKSI